MLGYYNSKQMAFKLIIVRQQNRFQQLRVCLIVGAVGRQIKHHTSSRLSFIVT